MANMHAMNYFWDDWMGRVGMFRTALGLLGAAGVFCLAVSPEALRCGRAGRERCWLLPCNAMTAATGQWMEWWIVGAWRVLRP